VQNANDSDAHITVRFLKSDGTEQDENYVVGANSRWTLDASKPLGQGVDSSAILESDVPVVASDPCTSPTSRTPRATAGPEAMM